MAYMSMIAALLLLLLQNMKKYFSFEVQVLDDKNVRRRFRASNYQVCRSALYSSNIPQHTVAVA